MKLVIIEFPPQHIEKGLPFLMCKLGLRLTTKEGHKNMKKKKYKTYLQHYQ